MSDKPPLTAAERRQLVHLSDKARDHHMDGRDHRDRRRLNRERELEKERERRWAGKVTTRADVIAILDTYIKLNLVPVAKNVDDFEAVVGRVLERLENAEAALVDVTRRLDRLEVPPRPTWWQRRVYAVRRWLDGKGIRFVRTDGVDE